MKKLISFALISVILMMFTACNRAKDKSMANQAKIYYEHLNSLGKIETEPFSMYGGKTMKYNVHELYYFLDDLNYDGIIDLAISAEIREGNGMEIYTLKDGQVKPLLSNHMPYSAGSETFTLAKCDNIYGIRRLRSNSVGEFNFSQINKDGTLKTIFEGDSYDIKGNALEDAANFDKIKPVNFYRLDELLKKY